MLVQFKTDTTGTPRYRELSLVGAVAKLPRDAETVAREQLDRPFVVRRRRPEEHGRRQLLV